MPEVDEKSKQKLTDKIEFESTRYGKMPFALKVVFIVATVVGIACATYFKIQGIRIALGPFSYTLSIGGYVLSDVQYYFLLYGIFGGSSFLLLPMRRSDRSRVPWYDMVLGFMALAIPFFYFLYSYQIQFIGWVPAPQQPNISHRDIVCIAYAGNVPAHGRQHISRIVYCAFPISHGSQPCPWSFVRSILQF
jgi:TRAP-type uncharacterized transport system fused permease subunit